MNITPDNFVLGIIWVDLSRFKWTKNTGCYNQRDAMNTMVRSYWQYDDSIKTQFLRWLNYRSSETIQTKQTMTKIDETKCDVTTSYISTTLLCKNIWIWEVKISHFENELICNKLRTKSPLIINDETFPTTMFIRMKYKFEVWTSTETFIKFKFIINNRFKIF